MDRITLLQEFRLIERSENEVNLAWKGAHLLLFFLAFVFGSFCTFCFHMLMYLFDEKCVLFPKLLSLSSLRHNVIYEFIPDDKEQTEILPVDFLSTQWVEKSACYLPTYVPLVSGIFGLVWITMFLMCSTGSRTLTGLQRPWRVVPPIFVFSLAMGGLCIYSSTKTHYGLQELCIKLGEITGSSTCSYTVNVATLAYERRIRGVYQATRLTIFSAWLHTSCWLLSALLALVRVLLAVDFQLVRVSVDLIGDLDKMLESHEEHIRTVSPNNVVSFRSTSDVSVSTSRSNIFEDADDISHLSAQSDIIYFADENTRHISEMSLVPEERFKLARLEAYTSVPKEKQFIVKFLYDLVDTIELPESPTKSPPLSISASSVSLTETSIRDANAIAIARQYGQETISSKYPGLDENSQFELFDTQEAEKIAKEIKRNLQERLNRQLIEFPINADATSSSTSKKRGHIAFESSMNITSEMKRTLEEKLTRSLKDADQEEHKLTKKSNLKNIGIQTDKQKRDAKSKQKVTISEPENTYIDSSSESSISKDMVDKDTQTYPKEKQD